MGIWSLISCSSTSWYLAHLKPGRYITRSPFDRFFVHFSLVHFFSGVKLRRVIYASLRLPGPTRW